MRTLREIRSNCVYEICLRAREGLPLPPTRVINAILKGIMARSQRDNKVIICHFLWMSNHLHILICTKDAQLCINFYTEIERKITEAIKRLIGLDFLHLWEGTPMVSLIPDIDTVKDRIAYFYSNPSEADLEDSIDRYPGLSSWNEFKLFSEDLNAISTTVVPWIRAKTIEKLPSRSLTHKQDSFFADKFIKGSKKLHNFIIEPNAWMKIFRVEDPAHVSRINQSIINDILSREQRSRGRRALVGKKVMGAHRLVSEPIMKEHTPKKKNKKIFVICLDKDLRVACIDEHKRFCNLRRKRYLQWKLGDFTSGWPPGAFRPPMPPLANAVQFH